MFITYHAEGDRDSDFVKAEMAQIQTTIRIELDAAKMSWMDILATAGNRRRALVTMFLGLYVTNSSTAPFSHHLC